MFFFSVLLVALWIFGPRMTDSAFSMCQDLDFEVARARRIQAVRGQILSKLQLETPPKEGGVPHPLPHEVMLLYNSTREPVRRMANCEGRRSTALRKDEEYYAKEVRRVEINLIQAELRIYKIPNPGSHATEQHVELSQVRPTREPSAQTQRYVGSRILFPRHRAEWVWFDVTENVRRRQNSACIFCPFTGLDDNLIKEAWKGWSRPPDLTHKAPHLILTLRPPNQLDPAPKGRHRRAANTPSCPRNSDKDCCLHPLYIDFRKDLNKLNPEGSAAPCCVAHKLEPLTILYYVGRQPKVQQLSNMIVKSCRCR
ncbi:hypothetical protein E2320_013882 [Naja naja]|nr:hypothetical protein E2320_013882 [Naja naja]